MRTDEIGQPNDHVVDLLLEVVPVTTTLTRFRHHVCLSTHRSPLSLQLRCVDDEDESIAVDPEDLVHEAALIARVADLSDVKVVRLPVR